MVLEFFQPETTLSRLLQGSYNRFVMPVLGGLVSGFGDAYRYLAGSIDAFETQGGFAQMLVDNGFEDARAELMFPPVASIVSGTRAAPGQEAP